MSTDSFDSLRSHLREMFQFDDSELDFGIYKVLKLKRREIQRFIDDELPDVVEAALQDVEMQQQKQRAAQVTAFVKEKGGQEEIGLLDDLNENKDDIEGFIRYKSPAGQAELLTALDVATDTGGATDELETRIYNHILRFFQRYYREGDFGYNDRSLQSYQVDYPDEAEYDGSDVLFHWKHKDSYYTKTGQGFYSVAFEIDGQRIKYVVEQKEEGVKLSQNNNKDDRKHYKLDRIEQSDEGTWQVIFHLSKSSTPKDEVYKQIYNTVFGEDVDYDVYLSRGDKPIFTDLEGDYDEVSDGQQKGASGRKTLRISVEKYCQRLVKNHREVFADLASNDDDRIAALAEKVKAGEEDLPARRFYVFDKNLNTFYIGQDADYFIHKHLKRFLVKEKKRYVRNVIFSDLDAVLDMAVDNTSVVVAKAFDQVVTRIIDFLAEVEDFQKHLFLFKKKVISTEYLISVGKIAEVVEDDETLRDLMERIKKNPAQIRDWKSTFGVEEPADAMQLVMSHPTLPVDTALFKEVDSRFKDDVLAHFEDLESATDGLLVNSDNLQALRLLKRTYKERVNCIYIDPPYNAESNSILYKNTFRHSSWLSLMENRMSEARPMRNEDGVQVVAIDKHEQERLGLLLRGMFPDFEHTCVTVVHNPSGQQGDNFSFCHDYAYFTYPSGGQYVGDETREEDADVRNFRDVTGESSKREAAQNCFYPILVKGNKIVGFGDVCDDDFHPGSPNAERADGVVEVYPIDPQGVERKWRFARQTVESIEDQLIATENSQRDVIDIKRVKKKFNFKTVWKGSRYSSNNHGTQVLNNIIGKGKFTFPKSVYTVQDSIDAALNNRKEGLVLDYFAGSGTTGQAVMEMNKNDAGGEGNRKFILVEMGEYFEDVLKERIRRVLYSENWDDGKPDGDVDGTVGLVKYQRLEQYEDVLNSLDTEEEETTLPDGVPLTYLYRPEEQAVRTSLDLSKPFSQTINFGPQQEKSNLDLIETYAYLKGIPVRQRRRYDVDDRVYRTLRSGRHLVIFRPISDGTDDTDALKSILKENDGVEVLHVNHDLRRGELEGPRLNVRVVTANDFDDGTSWT